MFRIKFAPLLFFSLILSTLSSCSSIEIFKENTEKSLQNSYRSYVIVNKEVGIRGFSSQIIDENLQIEIERKLDEQGWRYDKVRPDIVIRYTSNEDPRQRQVYNNNNPYPFWGSRVWDPWRFNPYMNNFNTVSTSNYELLQVIVDFIDPKDDRYLMTLTGVTEVSSPKHKQKKVLATLDKIMNTFLNEMNKKQ
jgi:hypothetical protein